MFKLLVYFQVVVIFNLFVTYGDTFLPSPSSYDELYYELVRCHQTFDALYTMALRYSTTGGEHKVSSEFSILYIHVYKTERCVYLSVCLSVCLSPFSYQTTGWIWSKLGMNFPLDHGNVLHIVFGGYPHERRGLILEKKLKTLETFPYCSKKLI